MKVYKDGYHCFTCGKNGDIFSFVQEMDHCDFKTSFISLGGEYKNDKKDFFQQQKLKNAMQEREKRKKAEERRKAINCTLTQIKREYEANLKELEPFSDEWCQMQNDLTIILGWLDSKIYEDCEVDTSGVISRYKQFKQNRNSIGRMPD